MLAVAGGALVPTTACAKLAEAPVTPVVHAASARAENTADLETIQALLAGNDPVTWVFTGDSITQGGKHTHGWRHYVQHFEERVRWELLRKWDFVFNTGVSGERTSHILNDFRNRVTRFAPDVVSLMIGTNDCVDGSPGRQTYRTHLGQLIEQIRNTGAVPVVGVFPPLNKQGDPLRADLPAYADIVREVAKEQNVMLVDHYSQWTDTDPKVVSGWFSDAIHPNEIGHLMMARKIFSDLGISDPDSATGSLRVG